MEARMQLRFQGLLAATCLAFLLISRSGPAEALNCKPLEPRGGENVDQTLQGKVDGTVDGLFKKLIGVQASLDGLYRDVRTDVLRAYPDASELYIWERLIFLKCELLSASKLDDKAKDDQFNELAKSLTKGPPDKKSENTPRPLKLIGDAVIIELGQQGLAKSDKVIKLHLNATPATPNLLSLKLIGMLDAWTIVGADYSQTGDLALFVNRAPNIFVDDLQLILKPEGFDEIKVNININSDSTTTMKLTASPLLSIDRITKLVTKDDVLSLDIILSNKSQNDKYINKITLVEIGANNNVCNPNPIVTFSYDIGIAIDAGVVTGEVGAKGDASRLPVTGKSEHSYCDGYLLASFPQTILIPHGQKLSYVLNIKSVEVRVANVIPPIGGGMLDILCKMPDALIDSLLSDCSKKSPRSTCDRNIAAYKEKVAKACKSPPDAEDIVIPRLGLSTKTLRKAAAAGMLNRTMKPTQFLLNDEPYYGGPDWTACIIVFSMEREPPLIGRFCDHAYFGPSTYGEKLRVALKDNGFQESEIEKILSFGGQ
jgi:hypothetical protein